MKPEVVCPICGYRFCRSIRNRDAVREGFCPVCSKAVLTEYGGECLHHPRGHKIQTIPLPKWWAEKRPATEREVIADAVEKVQREA